MNENYDHYAEAQAANDANFAANQQEGVKTDCEYCDAPGEVRNEEDLECSCKIPCVKFKFHGDIMSYITFADDVKPEDMRQFVTEYLGLDYDKDFKEAEEVTLSQKELDELQEWEGM